MLVIRLFRIGRRNQPAFKIVVTDSKRSSTRGRFVEEVGVYNPLSKQRNLKGDRIKYWISQGAQPSPTVHNMLVTDKVIEGKKIPKHKATPVAASAAEAENSATPTTPAAPAVETAPEPAPENKPEEVPALPAGGPPEEPKQA